MNSAKFELAIVVLGMHRSGTSALSGLLNIAGFDAPADLIAASQHNAAGFWESGQINRFNDEILALDQQTWFSIGSIGKQEASGHRAAHVERLGALIRQEFSGATRPVIKDPRICRLLDLWSPQLSQAAVRTVFPFVVRNPLEVAASLKKRNDLDPEYGMLLWARYVLDAEAGTRGQTRCFIDYNDLVDDWRGAVARMEHIFAIDFELDRDKANQLDSYLSGELRHQRSDPDITRVALKKAPILQGCYEICQRWAKGAAESDEDYASLDAFRLSLDQFGDLLTGAFEQARLGRKRLSSERVKTGEADEKLQQALNALSATETVREATLAQSNQIVLLREAVASQNIEFARLRDEAATWSKGLAELQREAASGRETAQAVGASLARLEDVAGLQGEAFSFLRGQINQLHALSSDRSIEETILALAQRHNTELDRLRAEQAALEQGLGARLDHLSQTGAELRQVQERLEEERMAREGDALFYRNRIEVTEKHNKSLREGRDAIAMLNRQLQAEAAELQGRIAERDRELASAAASAREADEEMKAVKHKYRAAQSDVLRERQGHGQTREELDAVKGELRRLRATLPMRMWLGAGKIGRKIAGITQLRQSIGKRRSLRLRMATIEQSALFDPDWYLARYPDVKEAGVDPLRHYTAIGWLEGRDPGPDFATRAYLRANPDVAGAGINPLVHYVEFGMFEGRDVIARQIGGEPAMRLPPAAAGTAPTTQIAAVSGISDFSQAAPVFVGELQEEQPVRWRRHYRLGGLAAADEAGGLALVEIDGVPVALGSNEPAIASLDASLTLFRRLSGLSDVAVPAKSAYSACDVVLVDAWHAGSGIFRMRFDRVADSAPFVVRAFQCDPAGQDRAMLLGEALVVGPLDTVDVSLANSFFPLLLVFAEPDGALIGAGLIAFPSLRRGGSHQAEGLLCINEAELATGLAALARGEARPAVTGLRFDLTDADGTQPLFNHDLRVWLATVARIGIEPHGRPSEGTGRGAAWMAEAVALEATAGRPEKGGMLLLGGEMIPTIAALSVSVPASESLGKNVWTIVNSIIEPADTALSPRSVTMPRITADLLDLPSEVASLSFPLLSSLPGSVEAFPAAAIRAVPRSPAAAEWLSPLGGAGLPDLPDIDDVVALIDPAPWSDSDLTQAIMALSLQDGVQGLTLAFVGTGSRQVADLASRLFPGRIRTGTDRSAAIRASRRSFVAWIGVGMVLHDNRTLALLKQLVLRKSVCSAGCTLVRSDHSGKTLLVKPVTDDGTGDAEAGLFWRATFPVARPSSLLWMARAKSLVDGVPCFAAKSGPEYHLRTGLVSASILPGYHGAREVEAGPDGAIARSMVLRELLQ